MDLFNYQHLNRLPRKKAVNSFRRVGVVREAYIHIIFSKSIISNLTLSDSFSGFKSFCIIVVYSFVTLRCIILLSFKL